MSYQKKYLKYKNKYLDLKNQIGGASAGGGSNSAGGGSNSPFSTGFSHSPTPTPNHLQNFNSNNTNNSDTNLFVSNITFEEFKARARCGAEVLEQKWHGLKNHIMEQLSESGPYYGLDPIYMLLDKCEEHEVEEILMFLQQFASACRYRACGSSNYMEQHQNSISQKYEKYLRFSTDNTNNNSLIEQIITENPLFKTYYFYILQLALVDCTYDVIYLIMEHNPYASSAIDTSEMTFGLWGDVNVLVILLRNLNCGEPYGFKSMEVYNLLNLIDSEHLNRMLTFVNINPYENHSHRYKSGIDNLYLTFSFLCNFTKDPLPKDQHVIIKLLSNPNIKNKFLQELQQIAQIISLLIEKIPDIETELLSNDKYYEEFKATISYYMNLTIAFDNSIELQYITSMYPIYDLTLATMMGHHEHITFVSEINEYLDSLEK